MNWFVDIMAVISAVAGVIVLIGVSVVFYLDTHPNWFR